MVLNLLWRPMTSIMACLVLTIRLILGLMLENYQICNLFIFYYWIRFLLWWLIKVLGCTINWSYHENVVQFSNVLLSSSCYFAGQCLFFSLLLYCIHSIIYIFGFSAYITGNVENWRNWPERKSISRYKDFSWVMFWIIWFWLLNHSLTEIIIINYRQIYPFYSSGTIFFIWMCGKSIIENAFVWLYYLV